MIGYVYKIVHIEHYDLVLYVGSTINIKKRWNNHVTRFNGHDNPGPVHRHFIKMCWDI